MTAPDWQAKEKCRAEQARPLWHHPLTKKERDEWSPDNEHDTTPEPSESETDCAGNR